MRSSERPSELRWLKGVACAVPLLLLPLLLVLIDMDVCELPRMARASCSGAPRVLYEVMITAGAICLLHSLYRGYRDFVRGELERDRAMWSGQRQLRIRDQEVAAAQPRADAENASAPAQMSLGLIGPSEGTGHNSDIEKKIEAMLAALPSETAAVK
jgi:hypothetical protein